MKYSHVLIPKSFLKGFSKKSGDGKVVEVLNLSNNTISTEKIKTLGTAENYFSGDAELYLNKNIEQPIGVISRLLKGFEKNILTEIALTKKDNETIIRFLYYCLLRRRETVKIVNENSIASQIIGTIPPEALFNLAELTTEANIFSGMIANILINRSGYGFVIPQNCYYQMVKIEGGEAIYTYILPVNPNAAFIIEREENHKKAKYAVVENKSKVETLNMLALKAEQSGDNGFIVSKSIDELIPLQNYLSK